MVTLSHFFCVVFGFGLPLSFFATPMIWCRELAQRVVLFGTALGISSFSSSSRILFFPAATGMVVAPPLLSSSFSPKVAVIGAGAAGLAAARILQRSNHDVKYRIIVLEADNAIGGVWRYHDDDQDEPSSTEQEKKKKKTRPMYRSLRTNLPKEIMGFRELPMTVVTTNHNHHNHQQREEDEREDGEDEEQPQEGEESFLSHELVREYLEEYCRVFQLRQYIHFGATVRHLSCISSCGKDDDDNDENHRRGGRRSAVSPATEDWPKLRLEWQQQPQQQLEEDVQRPTTIQEYCHDWFDAVFICNGHYNVPRLPHIPGLAEGYFRGNSIHSIEYDVPQPFRDRTVLCIGGRASGSDIAREIAALGGATRVCLSDSSVVTSFETTNAIPVMTIADGVVDDDENRQGGGGVVTVLPRTRQILPNGDFVFDHVDEPIAGIDVVIFCTGYDYSFPFLDDSIIDDNSDNNNNNHHVHAGQQPHSNIVLDASHRRVMPLYEQLWHADFPNIAFIGLPHSVVPFPLFELQAAAVEKSWRSPPQPRHSGGGGGDTSSSTTTTTVLPDRATRRAAAARDAASGGAPGGGGRVPDDTHYLGSAQWDYCRRMADLAGLRDASFDAYIDTNQVCMHALVYILDGAPEPVFPVRQSANGMYIVLSLPCCVFLWQAIYDHSNDCRKGPLAAGSDAYRSVRYVRMDEQRTFRHSGGIMHAAKKQGTKDRRLPR